jgi:hypothetical protein
VSNILSHFCDKESGSVDLVVRVVAIDQDAGIQRGAESRERLSYRSFLLAAQGETMPRACAKRK